MKSGDKLRLGLPLAATAPSALSRSRRAPSAVASGAVASGREPLSMRRGGAARISVFRCAAEGVEPCAPALTKVAWYQ